MQVTKEMGKKWKGFHASKKDSYASGDDKTKGRFISRCYPNRMLSVVHNMREENNKAIHDLGFGNFITHKMDTFHKKMMR